MLTTIIGPIALEWSKLYLKKIFSVDVNSKLKLEVNLNNLVDHEISQILELTHVDRVWIAQFHNGGNFYPSKKSIQKFSIFHEASKPGVSRIMPEFQNIPCSLFNKVFMELLQNDMIYVKDFSNPDEFRFGLEYTVENTGTKSIYMIPLIAAGGKMIGILSAEYVLKRGKFTEDTRHTIDEKAALISGILTKYHAS